MLISDQIGFKAKKSTKRWRCTLNDVKGSFHQKDINPAISITILNVSGLNTSIESLDRNPVDIPSTRNPHKDKNNLKERGWKCHTMLPWFFFLTEGVVSKSDKLDFRAKNTNSKKFYLIMLKSSIH